MHVGRKYKHHSSFNAVDLNQTYALDFIILFKPHVSLPEVKEYAKQILHQGQTFTFIGHYCVTTILSADFPTGGEITHEFDFIKVRTIANERSPLLK